MSAHFFEMSEDDSFMEVAKLIGALLDGDKVEGKEENASTEGARFVEESLKLYEEQNMAQLLANYIDKLDLVFSQTSEEAAGDIEGVLDLLCHLVPRTAVAGPQQVTESAQLLADRLRASIASASPQEQRQRLQALVTLHNVLAAPEEARHATLLALLGCAADAHAVSLILPMIRACADAWARDLGRDAPRTRAVMQAAAAALTSSTTDSPALAREAAIEADRLLVRVIWSYEGAPAAELASSRDAARAVVRDFVASPDAFTFDMVESAAVVALAGDASTASLHALLLALLRGSVAELDAVQAADGDLLPALGLSPEAARQKVRLMALARLAQANPVLSFDQLRADLGIDADQVEPLVVRAAGRGLVEARIDQLARTVTFTRSEPRAFGTADWKDLQSVLHAWSGALARAESVADDRKGLLQQGLTAIKA